MSEPKSKSFAISKWAVWEAYRRVKANKGAAGVDDQSIADFERDLSGSLFKLWNRLSSGSYFPPPVRAVEIPKKDGGLRVLCWATRWVVMAAPFSDTLGGDGHGGGGRRRGST